VPAPHVLRQAIHCCRNFGTVSIVGVYGGFVDKMSMGSAINRGLAFRMAQTRVQHYLSLLLARLKRVTSIRHSLLRSAPHWRKVLNSTKRFAPKRMAASR
jgi:threonine dehydrogenase-like Zn-dependent dehydrogenase